LGFGEVMGAKVPVLKVVVPLPKFDVVKPDDQSDEDFIAKIAAHADKLIRRYGWKERDICLAQIPTIRLNHVLESTACLVPDAPISTGGSNKRKGKIVDQMEAALR
jgi:hypothetical protein